MLRFPVRRSSGKRSVAATCSWVIVGFVVAALFQYTHVTDALFGRPSPERKVELVKLAVVMPFTKFDVEGVKSNFERWKEYPPCKRVARPRPTFFLYSNSELSPEIHADLDQAIANIPSSAKKCFESFERVHASIAAELDHYSPDARDSSWVAGPNEQFYQMVNGTVLPEDLSHVFMMEGDTRPIRPGWLDQLIWTVQTAEPFWIRGSSFRAPCAISKTKHVNARHDCHQLGPEIADHINGNAIYAVGDLSYRAFLKEVRASEAGNWPFDLAWLRYLSKPARESFRRSVLKNFVFTDIVQNIGAGDFNLTTFQDDNPWTFFVHSNNDGLSPPEEVVAPEFDISSLDPLLIRTFKAHASDKNNLMLAFGTKNYLDVTENFVHFVRKAGIDCFVLIAMDAETVTFAKEHGIPHYPFLDEEIAKLGGSDSYTSDGFRRIVNKRSSLISATLRAGFNILQTDVDVIWLKNPFHFFFTGDYEYEIQSDARVGFSEKDPAAPFKEFVNSGLFYARGTPRMADFYDLLIASVAEHPKTREQHLLNQVIQDNVLRIKYRVMDPILFPNGFAYFARSISTRSNIEPFCVHNNWLDGGAIKQYRFREINKWVMDPPEYFSKTERKYLAYYEPTIPNNGWNNVRNSLRAGIAIAKILNRTLILPKFYSHHNNSATVTLDYYLDYVKFAETIPNFRESTFTDKVFPETPEKVFHIDIGSSSVGPLPQGVPWVNFTAKGYFRGANDQEIKTWFKPYEDEPIIRLTSAFRRFHKFLDPEEDHEFNEMLATALTPSSFIIGTSNFIGQKMNEVTKAGGFGKWNCAHIRRGDFPSVHKGEKTLKEVAQLLGTMIPRHEPIYITSDESDQYSFRDTFRQQFTKASFWPEFDRPWFQHLYDPDESLGPSMRLGAIEQRVCAWSGEFVSNIYSTYSTHICYLRRRLGRTGERLCRDIYDRKYPADWEYY